MQKHFESAETAIEIEASRNRRFNRNCRCRLVAERDWVRSLLQISRKRLHPLDLRRWMEKYQDDCRRLQNCQGQCCPS